MECKKQDTYIESSGVACVIDGSTARRCTAVNSEELLINLFYSYSYSYSYMFKIHEIDTLTEVYYSFGSGYGSGHMLDPIIASMNGLLFES